MFYTFIARGNHRCVLTTVQLFCTPVLSSCFTCLRHRPYLSELAFSPVVSSELRAYIAHARSFEPHVPVELSNYIATAYAEMRQDEVDAGEKAMVREILT